MLSFLPPHPTFRASVPTCVTRSHQDAAWAPGPLAGPLAAGLGHPVTHAPAPCPQLRAFTDSRDDMALGHAIVLLQHEWPRGEALFLKAVSKICQQGNFQYENFFNYVTSILSPV